MARIRYWKSPQLIGFSAKNFQELKRVIEIVKRALVNKENFIPVVEIKPGSFSKYGMPLYMFNQGIFEPHLENLDNLEKAVKGCVVQFHLPYENQIDLNQERGLSIAIPEHHPFLLQRFEMFDEILKNYGLGETLTIHPPQIVIKGKKVATFTEALKNASAFFWKLDRRIRIKKWEFFVGVENQTDPKKDSATLGYEITHFREMLRKTRTIGLCVDVGHRKLSKRLRIRDLFQLARPVEVVHFHTNPGEWISKDHRDDMHKLAFSDNVDGYYRLLETVMVWRIPLILEISYLERYSDKELENYVSDLATILE